MDVTCSQLFKFHSFVPLVYYSTVVMLFTSETVSDLICEAQTTGSINVTFMTMLLHQSLPSFNNFSPLLQWAFVDALVTTQLPMTEITFYAFEQQH